MADIRVWKSHCACVFNRKQEMIDSPNSSCKSATSLHILQRWNIHNLVRAILNLNCYVQKCVCLGNWHGGTNRNQFLSAPCLRRAVNWYGLFRAAPHSDILRDDLALLLFLLFMTKLLSDTERWRSQCICRSHSYYHNMIIIIIMNSGIRVITQIDAWLHS